MEKISYTFNCPIHGWELSVLCFRAFSETNRHLWKKYIVEYEEAKFEDGELDLYLDKLKLGER